MNKDKFQQYLKEEIPLEEATLNDIKSVRLKYPYFQTVNLLLIKNLKKLRKSDYFENLQKLIIHIPNKEILHKHLSKIEAELFRDRGNGTVKKSKPNEKIVEKENKITTDNKKISSEKIPTQNQSKTKTQGRSTVEEHEKEAKVDILKHHLFELESDKHATIESANSPVKEYVLDDTTTDINLKKDNKEDDLISAFIKKQPKMVPNEEKENKKVDISGDSIKEKEDYMTETLAKVYIKQGYYSKAIFIYEKLSLKYPEKNTYFAAQIEKIKKLTNNL